MKYIDAEQLRTELKMLRRRYGYNELWDLSCYQAELGLARVGLIDEILSLLNTLEETSDNWKPSEEQKEVDLEKAAQHVYESWMGGTMDDVRRDMVELGKVLNARKEE